MLWFFDRDNESLRLETRYDNETLEFVALVRYPDGRDLERRFRDRREFREWLEAFEQALEGKRWLARRGPIILPYGWPDNPQD
jgi:hypothetical protein